MYQGSPRTSIPDMRGILQHTPQKVSGSHRASPSPNSLLSPSHRRTQGSGATSPMMIGDNVHYASMYSMPGQNQGLYHDHGHTSPVPSSMASSRATSFQSPSHSRSTSMTGMKNLMRDRALEPFSSDYVPIQGGPLVRDRSLDRHLDRHAYMQKRDVRDRSLDRDSVIARTLDRDSMVSPAHTRVRQPPLEYEYSLDLSSSPTPSGHVNHSQAESHLPQSQSVIMDFQSDMACLNRECSKLQQELDQTKEKLSSTMNSIKTFWSPELKKERALRKEESSRFSFMTEQLRTLGCEKQQLAMTVGNLEEQLRCKPSSSHPLGHSATNTSAADQMEKLCRERDKQTKELVILHKTVEELELRVETQKQTLGARNESIKKLLEMLQSKGLAVKQIQEDLADVEKFQNKAYEEEKRRKELEDVLRRRDDEVQKLNDHLASLQQHLTNGDDGSGSNNNHEDSQMQSIIEAKNATISRLEGDVRLLEEELIRLREDGLVTPRDRPDDKQVQALKSRERLLKGKIDNMLAELSRKDSELCALQTKLETSEKQSVDHQHYIAVLKEQIKAKDQRSAIQQSDMELLRSRLQDKEILLEKKSKALTTAQNERKEMESELKPIQDQLDMKERKIIVLQRKIDNLDDALSDRECQLSTCKARINSMHSDQSSSDSALSTLEDSIADKERQIERLKEQRDRLEREHTDEVNFHAKSVHELKNKIDNLQQEVNEKQVCLFELRDELSEVRSGKLKKESECNQLELQVSYKNDEILELTEDINKLREQVGSIRSVAESDQRNSELEKQLSNLSETVSKSHQEVDRLLTILKEMESEKHDKDNQIKALQEQVKECKQKAGTMKRSQQMEKKKSAELLEEARKREEDVSGDTEQMKSILEQREKRVDELEEALRESVCITADRELLIAEQQHMLEESELKIAEQFDEIDHFESKTREQNDRLKSMSQKLEENERRLRKLQDERRRHLEEVFEMKQEAILSAITEKDATIAVLEMSSTNTAKAAGEVDQLIKEKNLLQVKLREVTQNHMKLLQTDSSESRPDNSKDHKAIERLKQASTEQEEDEDGIWA